MFYVSLALSDTMFGPESGWSRFQRLTTEQVKEYLALVGDEVISALNPSHSGTIEAVSRKFGIELPVGSDPAPKISLHEGDYLLVFQAQFKRRLKEGERYTDAEVDAAPITFRLWTL